MNRAQSSTAIAGIDVSKLRLDVAVELDGPALSVDNSASGHAALLAWLHRAGVERVGLEASGGYERAVAARLAEAGLEVVLHQPLEVRLFARLNRQRAKNDRIDARLIAAFTASRVLRGMAADPRLAEFAERLTAYEQAADLVRQLKTHLEHTSLPDLVATLNQQLSQLIAHKQQLTRDLLVRLKAHPDFAHRFALLISLPGIGPICAMALCIRMPELGAMRRGQPAAMLGVAPFDHDSGPHRGQRHIAGGRARPRRLLYLAALAAMRSDPDFKAFYDRLAAAGKAPKLILVAIIRKLVEAANIVIARDKPWISQPA
jgi:transposase